MIETQQNKPLAYSLICLSIALTCFAVYFVLYSELLIMAPALLGIASLLFLLGRQKIKKWRMDNSKFNSYIQTATQSVLLFALALILFRVQGYKVLQYSPLILGFSSIALQFFILLRFRQLEPKLAIKLYDGVIFSSKWKHQKKAVNFIYNPFVWSLVKHKSIKITLYLNFIAAFAVLFLVCIRHI
jgi:hypothetical protein